MRVAQIVGTVTLSKPHETFVGSRLRLAIPYTFEELADGVDPKGEALVVWDELGAGIGSMILVAEGPEASQPFRPHDKAVDAYCAALLDDLTLDPKAVAMITRKKK